MKHKRSYKTSVQLRRSQSSSGRLIPVKYLELTSRNMTMLSKTLPSRMPRWTVITVALSLVASRAFSAVDHGKTFGAGGVAERFLAVDNAISYLEEGNSERRLQGELIRIRTVPGRLCLYSFPPLKQKSWSGHPCSRCFYGSTDVFPLPPYALFILFCRGITTS